MDSRLGYTHSCRADTQVEPADYQYLGAGRRASTLRALVRCVKNFLKWLSSAHQKFDPSEVNDLWWATSKFVVTAELSEMYEEVLSSFKRSPILKSQRG